MDRMLNRGSECCFGRWTAVLCVVGLSFGANLRNRRAGRRLISPRRNLKELTANAGAGPGGPAQTRESAPPRASVVASFVGVCSVWISAPLMDLQCCLLVCFPGCSGDASYPIHSGCVAVPSNCAVVLNDSNFPLIAACFVFPTSAAS